MENTTKQESTALLYAGILCRYFARVRNVGHSMASIKFNPKALYVTESKKFGVSYLKLPSTSVLPVNELAKLAEEHCPVIIDHKVTTDLLKTLLEIIDKRNKQISLSKAMVDDAKRLSAKLNSTIQQRNKAEVENLANIENAKLWQLSAQSANLLMLDMQKQSFFDRVLDAILNRKPARWHAFLKRMDELNKRFGYNDAFDAKTMTNAR